MYLEKKHKRRDGEKGVSGDDLSEMALGRMNGWRRVKLSPWKQTENHSRV